MGRRIPEVLGCHWGAAARCGRRPTKRRQPDQNSRHGSQQYICHWPVLHFSRHGWTDGMDNTGQSTHLGPPTHRSHHSPETDHPPPLGPREIQPGESRLGKVPAATVRAPPPWPQQQSISLMKKSKGKSSKLPGPRFLKEARARPAGQPTVEPGLQTGSQEKEEGPSPVLLP